MTETNVFQLAQPGTFTDLLTEVWRTGARALLAQAVGAEVRDSSPSMPISRPKTAAKGWCATDIYRNARS